MKTLVSTLIAGALFTTGAFAGEVGTPRSVAGNDTTIATPQLQFRPFNKRPSGARRAALVAPKDVATPQLPFRPYQKRSIGAPANKLSNIEAKRQ